MNSRWVYWVALAGLLCACPSFVFNAFAEDSPGNEAIKAAVAKSLPLLETGARGSMEKRKQCFTCHNQALPVMALTTARSRGFTIDAENLRRQLQFTADFLAGNRTNYLAGRGQGGQALTAGYALWTLEMGGWQSNETTDAVAEYLLKVQKDLDHWKPQTERPPMEGSLFSVSYVALRGLRMFGTAAQRERIAQRTAQVRQWVLKTAAEETEDRVFRLRSVHIAEAPKDEIRRAAQELLQTQRADGGWAQLDRLDSDAYATGTALVGLHQAGGLATADPAYRNGLRFLLAKQLNDGSWHVPTRSEPIQTYYESGYPHGEDQFISITAAGWATTALALALPEAAARTAQLEKQTRAPEKEQLAAAFPGTKSPWFGFDRYDFTVDGKPVLVVAPKTNAPGKPWVWHGEFFGHKPNPDLALLGRGFHVVYMSVPDMLGSPGAVAHWNVFYRELTERYGFARKAALVGLSRGGLYCYNWAAANPGKVACLYGDAPVCDFKSWPGAFGKGKRSDRDWQLVLERYGFKSDDDAKAYPKNPVDNLAPLAAARVPLLHVFGDADEVVPWDENTGLIAERYPKLGGNITLIRKPGVLHHPHGLDDSTPIVNFIWEHAANAEARTWLERHGGGPIDGSARPLIRKLGTIDLDMVETTPVVLGGKLWRFEWVRQGIGQQYWSNMRQTNYFRFRDPATGEITPPFAEGHEFGSAFVQDDTVYVTGTQGRNRVNMFASRDLKTWETWPVIDDKRYGIFNTSLAKTGDELVLAFEIDKPREEAGNPFTIRFAKSRDLRAWSVTPPECNFTRERYSAAPCLRWGDGWFYLFYLEAHQGYETRVVRSRDLVKWDASPLNPVLGADAADKQISNGKLNAEQRAKIVAAKNLNNSDLDFCEWQSRLTLNYSWGNQQGTEFLAEAVYDGTLEQFLRGWFPKHISRE